MIAQMVENGAGRLSHSAGIPRSMNAGYEDMRGQEKEEWAPCPTGKYEFAHPW